MHSDGASTGKQFSGLRVALYFKEHGLDSLIGLKRELLIGFNQELAIGLVTRVKIN